MIISSLPSLSTYSIASQPHFTLTLTRSQCNRTLSQTSRQSFTSKDWKFARGVHRGEPGGLGPRMAQREKLIGMVLQTQVPLERPE